MTRGALGVTSLNFPDKVESRFQCCFSGFPGGRTDLAGVLRNKLRGPHFSQEFLRISSNAVVMYFVCFQDPIGVDNKGAAQRESFMRNIRAKCFAECTRWIGSHWIGNFLNRRRVVVPCFMYINRVGADTDHLCADTLEFSIMICEFLKFCGADKGEVGWIPEEDEPFAGKIGERNATVLAPLREIGRQGKIREF